MNTVCVIALLALAAHAGAVEPDAAALAAPLPIPALGYLDQVAQEPAVPAEPARAERLAHTRGRADTASSAVLGAGVTGNSATDVATGANVINGGAFANMTGLPVVIQNSGANVLIQNATVINLQLR
jgi:hypothetical protein